MEDFIMSKTTKYAFSNLVRLSENEVSMTVVSREDLGGEVVREFRLVRKFYTFKVNEEPVSCFIFNGSIYNFSWETENTGNIPKFAMSITKEDGSKMKMSEYAEYLKGQRTKANTEVRHSEYRTIKECLEANVPIYLAGPAGSGKNYTVEQIAKELGWEFFFSNSVQQEYKLTGFIDAGGQFHDTEFYKACTCEKDCIFFLDEMDASIPEVLVLLNAAIANGYFEFPNGRISFDKVHFVAAGNTVGSGADEMYTGRMVLDQATLDRFVIIDFDYDLNIELSLAKGNKELVGFIRQLRDIAKEQGIRSTFSYRCITMVSKLENTLPLDKVMKIAVMKGLDNDTIRAFAIEGNTKYHKGLETLRKALR